ncbi:unnamed protein product [Heligmosomoides polygyrus]|uniref:CCHC-type domain-containing protein n=1 Tax=Heligmosomoides polygyrus TaxID=6339 RepID=A0A183G5X8_HELPZ|nr:unnamed protein product [Heligmosomoides polygyrus]
MDEGNNNQQHGTTYETPEAIREGMADNHVVRLDSRDLDFIIQCVKADQVPKQSSSDVPPFKREGYRRQYSFNAALVNKLSSVLHIEGSNDVIEEVIQELKVRNETLVIADNHPQVFQFLDLEEKADTLKDMDPRLSKFLDIIKKRDEEVPKKKKPSTQIQPFPAREAAWHTASPYSSFSMSRTGYAPQPERRGFPYSRREESPTRKSSRFESYKPYRGADFKDYRRKSQWRSCGREGHWAYDCPQRK